MKNKSPENFNIVFTGICFEARAVYNVFTPSAVRNRLDAAICVIFHRFGYDRAAVTGAGRQTAIMLMNIHWPLKFTMAGWVVLLFPAISEIIPFVSYGPQCGRLRRRLFFPAIRWRM